MNTKQQILEEFADKYARYFEHGLFGYEDLDVEEWLSKAIDKAVEEEKTRTGRTKKRMFESGRKKGCKEEMKRIKKCIYDMQRDKAHGRNEIISEILYRLEGHE